MTPTDEVKKPSVELENTLDRFSSKVIDLVSLTVLQGKPDPKGIEIKLRSFRTEAKEAITALHDKEIEYVIGEDEPITNFRDEIMPGAQRYNQLRAEQRKRWEERHG